MKLANLLDCNRILTTLMKKNLPASMEYILIHNLRILTPIVEDFEQTKIIIGKKYAKKDDNGNPIEENGRMPLDDVLGFEKEINEVLATETNIAFDKINKEIMERCDSDNLRYDPLTMEQRMMIEDYMM